MNSLLFDHQLIQLRPFGYYSPLLLIEENQALRAAKCKQENQPRIENSGVLIGRDVKWHEQASSFSLPASSSWTHAAKLFLSLTTVAVAVSAFFYYFNSPSFSSTSPSRYFENNGNPATHVVEDIVKDLRESILRWQSKGYEKRHITFGTTYVPGNIYRDQLSALVDENQSEYAKRWNLTHCVVNKSLLKNQCAVNGELQECSPYWNKIKVLYDWLFVPHVMEKNTEEWYIIADDDMIVTNMKIDPYKAIDQLRENRDTSIIVAKDGFPYTGNPITSVNTGLLFVRKDDASRMMVSKIWEKRNQEVYGAPSYCPTLGVCGKQHTLHEQQALSEIISAHPRVVDRIVSIVNPRETSNSFSQRRHIALNTFERSGQFTSDIPGWEKDCFDYSGLDRDHPESQWQFGDWMGQPTGVPLYGRVCNHFEAISSPELLRENKVQAMLRQTIKP